MSVTISAIQPNEATGNIDFVTMTTAIALKAADLKRAINLARKHVCRHVIPRMGRLSKAHTSARAGRVLAKHVRKADGRPANERIVCACGGVYVADSHGDYVCNVCGLIEDFAVLEQDNPADVDDEDVYADDDAGDSVAYDGMPRASGEAALEARLAANLASWHAAIAKRPADEAAAKAKARAAKDRHDDCVAANRAKAVVRLGDSLWRDARAAYRQRRIMAFVRDGVTSTVALQKALGVTAKATFYADVKALTDAGRLTSKTVGRETTLTYVAKAAPVRRVPAREAETSFKEAYVSWHTEQQTAFPWKAF